MTAKNLYMIELNQANNSFSMVSRPLGEDESEQDALMDGWMITMGGAVSLAKCGRPDAARAAIDDLAKICMPFICKDKSQLQEGGICGVEYNGAVILGTLISINSRFAKVMIDKGEIVKVGCSKVTLPPIKPGVIASSQIQDYHTLTPPKTQKKITPRPDKNTSTQTTNLPEPLKKIRKTSSGKIDNGDSVATLLRGLNLEEVYATAAEELGETVEKLKSRYSNLNPGQQRMCLGNRMRGARKARGTGV